MLRYVEYLPPEASEDLVADVCGQLRAYLSAIADYDDDPEIYAHEVAIHIVDNPGGDTVRAELDRPPDAPYLRADFDPDGEADPFTYQPFAPQE